MRILIISHAAGTPQIGPNMRTFYLARNLVAKGHKVRIIGSGHFHKYNQSPLPDSSKPHHTTIEGIEYTWLPTRAYTKRNYQQVLNQWHFAWLLYLGKNEHASWKPNVVIMSSPPPFGIYGAAAIAKKARAKLIFEIRDLWPEIIQELGNFSAAHPFLRLVRQAVKWAYKRAHAIVSVKPGDLTFIKSRYNPKGVLRYIPNGFDHNYILDEDYKHEAFNTQHFKVVYTGALSNYYALQHLLEAANSLKTTHPQIQFIIVGDGEDRRTYEKMKEDWELDNVVFTGHLAKKYMLSVIRQSDVAFVGLKNTKANKFGISTNKLYEYMYAQKPILASYLTDHDIVAESGGGLSVKPESAVEIEKALLSFYNMSPRQRDEMASKGYAYLMKHHTFDQISERYVELIHAL